MANKNKAQNSGDIVSGSEKEQEVEKKEITVSPNSMVDKSVTVISLDLDPYHKTGEEFHMGESTAKTLAAKGWVEIKKEEETK